MPALVADWNRDVYELCGEGKGCGPFINRCYRVSIQRVDCVASYQRDDEQDERCGLVVTAVLRGLRIHGGTYACRGSVPPVTRARFIRPSAIPRFSAFGPMSAG